MKCEKCGNNKFLLISDWRCSNVSIKEIYCYKCKFMKGSIDTTIKDRIVRK